MEVIEKTIPRQVVWRSRHIDRAREIQRGYYYRNQNKILQKKKECRAVNREEYNKRHREQARIRLAKLKDTVLTFYGGGVCRCVVCGEDRVDCLSLDHINNDGYKHRKTSKLLGSRFYAYLAREGLPAEYQTLCMNCQWIKKAKTQHEKRAQWR